MCEYHIKSTNLNKKFAGRSLVCSLTFRYVVTICSRVNIPSADLIHEPAPVTRRSLLKCRWCSVTRQDFFFVLVFKHTVLLHWIFSFFFLQNSGMNVSLKWIINVIMKKIGTERAWRFPRVYKVCASFPHTESVRGIIKLCVDDHSLKLDIITEV